MFTKGQLVTIMFAIEGKLVSSEIRFSGKVWRDGNTTYGQWINTRNGNDYWFTGSTVEGMIMDEADQEDVESYS
jgi:hypothetical protein